MHTKKLLALIAPVMSFSLISAACAGNEPVTPSKLPTAELQPAKTNAANNGAGQRATTGKAMDRPQMAPFKRIQMYAFKFRQKLSNLQAILDQSYRVNAISEADHKKLQKELDHLCEVEPSLARGGWKDEDIEQFDKDIAKYQTHFEKTSPGSGMPAQISAPAGKAARDAATAAKDAAAATTKSPSTAPKK